MKTLRSYIEGRWIDGSGAPTLLVNPATEEPLAEVRAGGFDWSSALRFSKERGGAALRSLSLAERGALLKAASKAIFSQRDALLALSIANNGTTRSDAKFDIDGATGTLAFYGDLGQQLGDRSYLVDGDGLQLTRSVRFFGQHVGVPRRGVAIHINAFNFPAWNMMEKAALALLAGMPVVTKPATSTALTAHRIFEILVEQHLFPEGALSLCMGSVGSLLDHLDGQDCIAFTGSSDTGQTLRQHPNVVAQSVRLNVEADSLNSALLGRDAARDSDAYAQFIADVSRDLTQKSGQKCTAIRRIFVPTELMEAVREDLSERLATVRVGDPALEEVTMGPVATAQQRADVRAGLARLREEADVVFGGDGEVTPVGVEPGRGFFVGPVLLQLRDGAAGQVVHSHEVFGPVATLVAYDGSAADAIDKIARGQGSLVSSVYSDDRMLLGELALGLAPYNGRLFLGSSKLSGHAVGPGTVLPQLLHGGPGRAGGGEELGGARGLWFYLQRTAIAGDRPILDALFGKPASASVG